VQDMEKAVDVLVKLVQRWDLSAGASILPTS
jgi:hypothetical protein